MELCQIGFVNNSQQVEFSNSQRTRENKTFSEPYDTVEFSDTAMAFVKQMYLEKFQQNILSADDNTSAESSVQNDYKKIFDEYRQYGLFSESSSSSNSGGSKNNIEADKPIEDKNMTSEDMNKEVSKLEKQLKDLMQQLEEVLTSNLPEMEKNTKANEIQKKISELQSQLTVYKRATQAMKSAESLS